MKKSRVRLHILWKWVISYTLALLIMLAAMMAISNYMLAQIREQINNSSVSTVTRLVGNMDDTFESIERMMTEVGINDNVIALYSTVGPQRPYHQYKMFETVQDIRLYNIAHSNIDTDSPLLYISNRGGAKYFIKPSARYNPEMYFELSQFAQTNTYEQWINRFNILYQGVSYQIVPAVNAAGQIVETICLFKTLNISSVQRPTATLLVCMDMGDLRETLREYLWLEESALRLTDADGSLILTVGGAPDADYEPIPFREGGIDSHSGNIVISKSSAQNGFRYQYIVPESIYMQKVRNVRSMLYFASALCFAFGALVVAFIARRHLRPISSLAQTVMGSLDTSDAAETMNLFELNRYVGDIIVDSQRKSGIIDEQNELLRMHFLQDLLIGNMRDTDEYMARSKATGVYFNLRYLLVVLIEFANCEETEARDYSDEYFAVANIASELLNEKNICHICPDGEFIACVVNTDAAALEAAESIAESMKRLIAVFEGHYESRLNIYISGAHYSYRGIAECRREAMHMAEYHILSGRAQDKIVLHNNLKVYNEDDGQLFTIEHQQPFLNYIKTYDFQGAKDYMGIIMDDIFSRNLSLEHAKCCMFAIINTMINAIYEISANIDDSYLEMLSPNARLLGCSSVRTLKEQMEIIFDELKDHVETKNNESIRSKLDEIRRYVEENYADPDLNVSMIAYHFDTTISTLSRFYKKQTQDSLLDTIRRLRHDKAKELLAAGIAIKEVATAVGYADSNAFIRSFKAYEGITPGKFRLIKEQERGKGPYA